MKYFKKLIAFSFVIFLFSMIGISCAFASQNDALDVSIRKIVKEGRTKQMCDFLKIEYYPKYSREQQVTYLNKKIRHGFGHTVANIFRDNFKPDYGYILAETLKKMNITYPDNTTIYDAEYMILRAVANGQRLNNEDNCTMSDMDVAMYLGMNPSATWLDILKTQVGVTVSGMMKTNWERTLASIVFVTLHRHGRLKRR